MAPAILPSLASIDRPMANRRLRVCIATEDIAGPTRNGGVGSTYAALAKLLAADGHDVTVLHLRPEGPEQGDIASWSRHFEAMGIRYAVCAERARRDGLRRPAERWFEGGYELLGWLLDHPVDVVHASEWGALAYICLLAKARGLAFCETTFVIKASSPLRWSLEAVGGTPSAGEALRVDAERRSVELADIVVGGSAYLLDWMRTSNYRLPPRTHVQPNVVTPFDGKPPTLGVPHRFVDELAFFGRLESRKGLDLFCRAVDRLILAGEPLPRRVAFVGKPGRVVDGGAPVLDSLQAWTSRWPFPVLFKTEESCRSALHWLHGGPRLAVCPSLGENASVALHELMLAGLPFVATDVGGNAELIRADDRSDVLCAPSVEALAEKLARVLSMGARVPRLAFDNTENLEVWKRFHRQLAAEGPGTPRDTAPAASASTILCPLAQEPKDCAIDSEPLFALLAKASSATAGVVRRRPRPRGAPPQPVQTDFRYRRFQGAPPPPRAPRRPFNRHALAAAGVEGWCDPSADGVVRGWAWRFDSPNRPVKVAVYVDGELHACVNADLYREDLARAGVGDGGYGFNVPLPPTLDRSRRVDVIAACARLPLDRSPLVAVGPRLRPL